MTMRKLIVSEFISLDGVIEAPQNWHFPYVTDDMMEVVMKSMNSSDAYLYGRVTYQEFAGYWPTAEEDGSGLATKLNSTPMYVVSNTLKKAEWANTTILKGDPLKTVADLKKQPGGEIGLTGSATLTSALAGAGLIDEYLLFVHPVVVGSGKRLFQDGVSAKLKLAETRPFKGGVVLMVYQPDAEKSK
jgi:dihydrofolate reductase